MVGLGIAKFCGKHFGLYTRKEMVRVCKDIGRELVDIQKSGAVMSRDVVQSVIGRRAPKVKFKFCTSRAELKADLLSHGINEQEASKCVTMFDDAAGLNYEHLGGDGKCKGIFVPLNDGLPAVLAHEFEHYLFQQKSFMSKFLPKKLIQNRSNSALAIQKNLMENVDLSGNFMFRSSVPLKEGEKNLVDFLKNFDGLETKPRIDAYFRGMCRNATHPRNKGAFGDILSARQIIQDEKRAYDVTDDIVRYSEGIPSGNKTCAGVFSELLGFTDDVLRKEQITALTVKTSPHTVLHSCPNPTHELDEMSRIVRDITRRKARAQT